jgi:hypothetical protein
MRGRRTGRRRRVGIHLVQSQNANLALQLFYIRNAGLTEAGEPVICAGSRTNTDREFGCPRSRFRKSSEKILEIGLCQYLHRGLIVLSVRVINLHLTAMKFSYGVNPGCAQEGDQACENCDDAHSRYCHGHGH